MCRMPSPLPGPLRGEPDRELEGVTGTWAKGLLEGVSLGLSRDTPDDTLSTADGSNARRAPVGRVA
jgi:hypothetical protein